MFENRRNHDWPRRERRKKLRNEGGATVTQYERYYVVLKESRQPNLMRLPYSMEDQADYLFELTLIDVETRLECSRKRLVTAQLMRLSQDQSGPDFYRQKLQSCLFADAMADMRKLKAEIPTRKDEPL